MSPESSATATARRIVDEVLTEHGARSEGPERRQVVEPAAHPDTPAWRAAHRIVTEAIAEAEARDTSRYDVRGGGGPPPPPIVGVRQPVPAGVEAASTFKDRSAPEVGPMPQPDPMPAPLPDPTPDPLPAPLPDPTPDPLPAPLPDPMPDPAPEPAPEPEPMPEPEPVPSPIPVPQPVPEPAPQPVPFPEPGPVLAAEDATDDDPDGAWSIAARIVREVLATRVDEEPAEPVSAGLDERASSSSSASTEGVLEAPAPSVGAFEESVLEAPAIAMGDLAAPLLTDSDRPSMDAEFAAEDAWADPQADYLDEDGDDELDAWPEALVPRRMGRWLLATVLGALALAVLLPLAIGALRDLVALS